MIGILDGKGLARITRGSFGRAIAWRLGAPALAVAMSCGGPDAGLIQDADLAGLWSGSFHFLRDSVHVVLELEAAGSGILSGRVSLPAQSLYDAPVSAERIGRELRIGLPSLRSRFEGRLARDGESIRGDWLQAGGKFRLSLTPTSLRPRPHRPQEPQPPFPYQEEAVRITHSDGGVVLSGTLFLPDGEGSRPSVVLVSGSGPQDRDEALFGHKPFLVLADHLARSGIAVLRYDDRGVGESEGDFASATTEDFATDALAAVQFMVEHQKADPESVGIIGHSEGGIVAPIAAARSNRVAFIVSLAGTGIPGRDLLELQTRKILEASGVPAPLVELNGRLQESFLKIVQEAGDAEGALEVAREELEGAWGGLPQAAIEALGFAAQVDRAVEEQVRRIASPWLFFFLSFDPGTAFEKVTVPVLAVNGSLDLQVPSDPNLRLIRQALERGGNQSVTVVELEGLNHLFQTAETGLPSEYGRIEETMAPQVLHLVSDWILARASSPSPIREGGKP